MATSTDVLVLKNDTNTSEIIASNGSTSKPRSMDDKKKICGAIFFSAVTTISGLIGFSMTLVSARKNDPKYFEDGIVRAKGASESGAMLAMKALGWGTFYAVSGCGVLFYSIWKLSGATNAEEFRNKMGSILPRIPRNDPPQSRIEFDSVTDLLTYVSHDWGKEKTKSRK